MDHLQTYNMLIKYIYIYIYVYLLVLFPFNSQVFNVSNCILFNNYVVFMKKIFSHIILSMKTFSHVVISRVTRIQLGTKNGIYDCIIRKWLVAIFVPI
jgi:hypothetical protein